MTPADLPVALGVCRLAARLDPIPTACGHPSSRLRRRRSGRGTVCLDCHNEWKAAR